MSKVMNRQASAEGQDKGMCGTRKPREAMEQVQDAT